MVRSFLNNGGNAAAAIINIALIAGVFAGMALSLTSIA